MTDEEMAVAVGEYILDLRHELATLKAILDQMKFAEGGPVPWRMMRDWDLEKLRESPISHDVCAELQRTIGRKDDLSASPLEKLYHHFLG